MAYVLPELRAVLDDPLPPEWNLAALRDRAERLRVAALNVTAADAELMTNQVESTGLPVRSWYPTALEPTALVLWIHGGGFVMGDPILDDASNADLAVSLGAIVAAPGYRLAPEHPFPEAAKNLLAAYRHVAQQHPHLPIIVMGDSAGGGLVETLACLVLDEGDIRPPHALVCLEPVTDPASAHGLPDSSPTSMSVYADSPMWHRTAALASWRSYLGETTTPELPRLVDRTDTHSIPPMLVAVAQSDILRDEGVSWALNLANHDVHVELHLVPGTVHGSLLTEGTRTRDRVKRLMTDFLDHLPVTQVLAEHEENSR